MVLGLALIFLMVFLVYFSEKAKHLVPREQKNKGCLFLGFFFVTVKHNVLGDKGGTGLLTRV